MQYAHNKSIFFLWTVDDNFYVCIMNFFYVPDVYNGWFFNHLHLENWKKEKIRKNDWNTLFGDKWMSDIYLFNDYFTLMLPAAML